MRGRDCGHVKDFAVRGVAPVKIVAVPRCKTHGTVIDVFLGHVDTARNGVRLANAIDPSALRHWLPGFDDARTGGNAIARINAPGATRTVGDRQAAYPEHDKARATSITNESPQVTHPYSVPDRKPPVYPAAERAETVRASGGKWLVPQRSGWSSGIAAALHPG